MLVPARILIFFNLRLHPAVPRVYSWLYSQESFLSVLRESHTMSEMEPRSAICKANDAFQPSANILYIFFLDIEVLGKQFPGPRGLTEVLATEFDQCNVHGIGSGPQKQVTEWLMDEDGVSYPDTWGWWWTLSGAHLCGQCNMKGISISAFSFFAIKLILIHLQETVARARFVGSNICRSSPVLSMSHFPSVEHLTFWFCLLCLCLYFSPVFSPLECKCSRRGARIGWFLYFQKPSRSLVAHNKCLLNE